MPRLQIDQTAWDAGFRAGAAGERAKCPYPAGTRQAWSWESGKVEGDAKRQGYSYSKGAKPNPPDNRITQAVEVLRAAYVPAATRGTMAQAISEALDVLEGGDDYDQAA